MQNLGRLPIISDTTRSYTVVENSYGSEPEDIEIAGGFYVAEHCPVRGNSIISDGYATAEEARAFLNAIMEG